MTSEQQQGIFSLARKILAGDVEWMDIWPVESPIRPAFDKLLSLPPFIEITRDLLEEMFAKLTSSGAIDVMVGRQEPELEAAGLVQAALKASARYVLGGARPDIAQAIDTVWIIKVRQIPYPIRQGRPGQHAPSLAEQQSRIAAGRSPL